MAFRLACYRVFWADPDLSPTVAMYLVPVMSARNAGQATGFLGRCFATGRGWWWRYPNGPRLIKSSLALIVVLIGFRIGEMLRHRVSQELFRKAVLVAFFFMGLRLIINGLT